MQWDWSGITLIRWMWYIGHAARQIFSVAYLSILHLLLVVSKGKPLHCNHYSESVNGCQTNLEWRTLPEYIPENHLFWLH